MTRGVRRASRRAGGLVGLPETGQVQGGRPCRRAVLEVAVAAPEEATAEVGRVGRAELRGEVAARRAEAPAPRRAPQLAVQVLEPTRGEREPRHVVVEVVDPADPVAQPDRLEQPVPLRGMPIGASEVTGPQRPEAGVDDRVEVVRLPPVVPRPEEAPERPRPAGGGCTMRARCVRGMPPREPAKSAVTDRSASAARSSRAVGRWERTSPADTQRRYREPIRTPVWKGRQRCRDRAGRSDVPDDRTMPRPCGAGVTKESR